MVSDHNNILYTCCYVIMGLRQNQRHFRLWFQWGKTASTKMLYTLAFSCITHYDLITRGSKQRQ